RWWHRRTSRTAAAHRPWPGPPGRRGGRRRRRRAARGTAGLRSSWARPYRGGPDPAFPPGHAEAAAGEAPELVTRRPHAEGGHGGVERVLGDGDLGRQPSVTGVRRPRLGVALDHRPGEQAR